jgi:hypothetical protein
MSSNFPNGPDSIVNNVDNTTPEFDIHPPLHNQLADSIMAVQVSLLAGGSLSLADHVAASDPHPVYLTQTEGDARYAPISGGGYLTQVQADARYLQLTGGTLTGHLLFSTDNLRDIGAPGATRPRTLYLGTSLVTPGWTNGTNLLANTDNTYDIGASAASRPRNVFAGTAFQAAPGLGTGNAARYGFDPVSPPAISPQVGMSAYDQNTLWLRSNGSGVTVGQGFLRMATMHLAWGPDYNTEDLAVWRDAANTLAQRNGTSAQTLRIYSTFTDASNYQRLAFNAMSGLMQIAGEAAGTGSSPTLSLIGNTIALATAGTTRWQIQNAGHLTAQLDNSYDIGASGANRPRNIYVAGAVVNRTKAGVPVDADVTSPADGMLVVDTTNNQPWVRASGQWCSAASSALGVTNLLTNGGFEIWQRGNGPFTAGGLQTTDRWQFNGAGSDTFSLSKDTANIDAGGSQACAAIAFTLGTGAGASTFGQQCRNSDGYQNAGRTYSFSIRVRTATANAVRIALWTNGSSGTISGTTHGGGGTYQTLTVTGTTSADTTIIWPQLAFLASCTAYIDNAMLVVGSQPANYAPLHPADDLARCLRYYETIGTQNNYPQVSGIATAASQTAYGNVGYKASKPVTPTVTKIGTWTVSNCTQPTVGGNSGLDGCIIQTSSSAAGGFVALPVVGTAYLTVEANP